MLSKQLRPSTSVFNQTHHQMHISQVHLKKQAGVHEALQSLLVVGGTFTSVSPPFVESNHIPNLNSHHVKVDISVFIYNNSERCFKENVFLQFE